MMKRACLVDFQTLERFIRDALCAVGCRDQDAALCADVILAADRQGIDSHGVGRFKPIYMDRILSGQVDPKAQPVIVREGPTTAVVDGRNGMGQVASAFAMNLAVRKARDLGLGMVAVRGSNHYGIAGYYVRMAAEAGMVGVTGTNARPSVAPTFGIEPMLGTNPLTFGIPTDESFPYILDCATSASQRGKIEMYARQNRPSPRGWVMDMHGKSRTDSKTILRDLVKGKASLLPLGGSGEKTGGHKGYGYATVVEILSSALAGGAFLHGLNGSDRDGRQIPLGLGHFFMAVDVSAFNDPSAFRKNAGDILRALRSSRKAPGSVRIFTAGEKEYLAWMDRKDKGIVLDLPLQSQLLEIKNRLRLDGRYFPFE